MEVWLCILTPPFSLQSVFCFSHSASQIVWPEHCNIPGRSLQLIMITSRSKLSVQSAEVSTLGKTLAHGPDSRGTGIVPHNSQHVGIVPNIPLQENLKIRNQLTWPHVLQNQYGVSYNPNIVCMNSSGKWSGGINALHLSNDILDHLIQHYGPYSPAPSQGRVPRHINNSPTIRVSKNTVFRVAELQVYF